MIKMDFVEENNHTSMSVGGQATPITGSASVNNMMNTSTEAQSMLDNFWPKVVDDIKKLTVNDFKQQELPLARIKKIMKLDDDVKVMMISAEAPVLFAKAAEIFITEISLRAWIHTEDNKRRTLQRNDIAMAITKYDQFDFLIDIVPRDELAKPPPKKTMTNTGPGVDGLVGGLTGGTMIGGNLMQSDQVQLYLQQALQQSQLVASQQQQTAATQQLQVIQQPGSTGLALCINQQGQLMQVQMPTSSVPVTAAPPQVQQTVQTNHNDQPNNNSTHQVVTNSPALQTSQALTSSPGQVLLATNNQSGGDSQQQLHIVQTIVNGQIQQLALTTAQLQMLKSQAGAGSGQSLMIQQPAQQTQQYQFSSGQQFVVTPNSAPNHTNDGNEESLEGDDEDSGAADE